MEEKYLIAIEKGVHEILVYSLKSIYRLRQVKKLKKRWQGIEAKFWKFPTVLKETSLPQSPKTFASSGMREH